MPGGFSFNQYLVVDDEPLLFHTGPRGLFPLVREAIATVMPVERLRWIGFSHFEADECGALNELLAAAPRATPLCGQVGAMVSIGDSATGRRAPLADGEALATRQAHASAGSTRRTCRTRWECGFMFEDDTTRTLLCGDLFTQPAPITPPLTEADILGPSEAFRAQMDYFSHTDARARDARAARGDRAAHARLHARLGVARRRRASCCARSPMLGSAEIERAAGDTVAGDGDDDAAEDAVLARRIVAGDRDAESALCRALLPRVRAWGLKHMRDEAAARDLAQHVVLAVLEALRAGRVTEIDRLGAFVIGTCKNTLLAQRRGERRRATLLEQFGPALPALPSRRLGARPAAARALLRATRAASAYGARPDVLRRALRATRSRASSACRPGNVRVARHRALAQLHDCMGGAA